jgi:methylmalonyl-CoA/ethylmalonyl-CoA epimerase
MLGALNHVAMAVPNLEKAAALYRDKLGAKVSEPQILPEHGVTVVFIELSNTKLELLEPYGENSPIKGFLEKNPEGGIHHICIEVDDITSSNAYVREKGLRVVSGDLPKIGAHNKPVLFLHPKDLGGVLLELEQA